MGGNSSENLLCRYEAGEFRTVARAGALLAVVGLQGLSGRCPHLLLIRPASLRLHNGARGLA